MRGSWGGGSEPPPHQLGGLGERCEFGAFWDMKIASEQCKMMVFVN